MTRGHDNSGRTLWPRAAGQRFASSPHSPGPKPMTADLEDENLGHHGPKARDRETALDAVKGRLLNPDGLKGFCTTLNIATGELDRYATVVVRRADLFAILSAIQALEAERDGR